MKNYNSIKYIKKLLFRLTVLGAVIVSINCQGQIKSTIKMNNEQETSNQTTVSSTAYLVVNAKLNTENQDDIKVYTGNVIPLLKNAGGRNLKRAKLSATINGESKYPLLLFMEFDNEDAIKAAFESEAYKKLIPFRDRAFEEIDIYVFLDM